MLEAVAQSQQGGSEDRVLHVFNRHKFCVIARRKSGWRSEKLEAIILIRCLSIQRLLILRRFIPICPVSYSSGFVGHCTSCQLFGRYLASF